MHFQYVFLTMEAMIDAAVHIGFPRDMAVKLVTSTIRGSASYAMKSPDSIGMLRNKVSLFSLSVGLLERIYTVVFNFSNIFACI